MARHQPLAPGQEVVLLNRLLARSGRPFEPGDHLQVARYHRGLYDLVLSGPLHRILLTDVNPIDFEPVGPRPPAYR